MTSAEMNIVIAYVSKTIARLHLYYGFILWISRDSEIRRSSVLDVETILKSLSVLGSSFVCEGPLGLTGGSGEPAVPLYVEEHQAEVASTRSNCPRLILRRRVRVGAWNARSLRQDDRLPLLSRELGKLRVVVAALAEVRRPGSGTISVGGYTYYWSRHSDGHHLQGVAMVISSRLQPSVVEVTPIDEHIMVMRLKQSSGFMSLITVYAPTDRPDPHRWTWYSDAGNAAKEIDPILVSPRWRILQNCRVYRSAEFCGTDHRLVVATLQVHFKTPQLDRLREGECARRFAEAFSGRFIALENLTDHVLLWDTFKREILDAAQETIGERTRAGRYFISQETLDATDACRAARLAEDRDLHHSQVRRTRSLLRRDKEQFLRNFAEEVEGHFLVNDLRPAYQALRKLNSKPSSQVTAVRSVSGQIISGPVVVRERWAEYFEQLY
ncbi:uncharacterized protein [Penaeus vannamei]|uniref:uncharacterized protein n=1 Tax=Penaeus vannamei TaxID=6689 RepID=UPI00387F95BB